MGAAPASAPRMILSLRAPSEARVRALLAAVRKQPFTHGVVGCTQQEGGAAPAAPGFDRDETRCVLGHGVRAFRAACDALRAWHTFDFAWVRLLWPQAPIRAGTMVAAATRQLGLWSLNPCRIAWVVDEPRRFGFAYGTLPGHAESGEELFLVTLDEDGVVGYTIRAVSRPNHLLVWCVKPYVRRLQARFRRDSGLAIQRAVRKAMHDPAQDAAPSTTSSA